MIRFIAQFVMLMSIITLGYGLYIQYKSGIEYKDALLKAFYWFPDLIDFIKLKLNIK
jgi:hypothetical protein